VSVLTDSVSGAKTSIGGLTLSSSVVPGVGVGYENRSDAGYLFRVTGYALIGEKVIPWGGFSFGYSF